MNGGEVNSFHVKTSVIVVHFNFGNADSRGKLSRKSVTPSRRVLPRLSRIRKRKFACLAIPCCFSVGDSSCVDSAAVATDIDGDGCEMYPLGACSIAANFDDVDFSAKDMCCLCGGGVDTAHHNGPQKPPRARVLISTAGCRVIVNSLLVQQRDRGPNQLVDWGTRRDMAPLLI